MMKFYLLLFISFALLLFATPKSGGMRSFEQQRALNKSCAYSKPSGKKPCAKKCLKHQTHSNQQDNPAGIVYDCSQQIYALVNDLQAELIISFTTKHDFMLPHIRKHLSPILEYDPQPPRLS
ncbi:hypothetical protein [Pontibacter kalidii]|uniref:hypothetical protein n=1 Tax=Pontibacter kalidii TaxID=2592049 RepID=UPI00225203D6|nr:hypothetical protein [Pontibacter kalidii]